MSNPPRPPRHDPELADRIRRIKATRLSLKVAGWGLLITALFFFVRQNYLLAIPMGLGAVVLAFAADWVVKPPDKM